MIATASDYGPFAPVVGYAGAIMATAGALFTLWAGKMEKWRPPDEDLPGTAQSVAVLLCGVGMVMQWYFAVPNMIGWFLGTVGLFVLACVVCLLSYTRLLGTYIYIRKEATGLESTRDVRILGGAELLPEAEEKRRQYGIDIQTLFEGAAYNPDLLWSRESRQAIKQRILIFFILTLVLGTSALTGSSFAVQVMLTKRAAASVIRSSEAPGLDTLAKPQKPISTK